MQATGAALASSAPPKKRGPPAFSARGALGMEKAPDDEAAVL